MLGRGSGRVVEKWEDGLNSQQKEIRENINTFYSQAAYIMSLCLHPVS